MSEASQEDRKKIADALRKGKVVFPTQGPLSLGRREDIDPKLMETRAWNDYVEEGGSDPEPHQAKALLDLFEANVAWVDEVYDPDGEEHSLSSRERYWQLTWPFGFMALTPKGTLEEAWCHAARFVYLWLKGIRCDIADHLAHYEAYCLREGRSRDAKTQEI